MAKAKHTPGPWLVSYERGTTQIRCANGESIMGDETYYPWVPENDADWHLIAAAPDLLEALGRLVTAVEDGCLCSEMEMATVIDEARAAIAKAKGGDT